MFAKSMPDYGKPSATMNFKREKLLETTISDQQTAGLGYADNSHCGIYMGPLFQGWQITVFLMRHLNELIILGQHQRC